MTANASLDARRERLQGWAYRLSLATAIAAVPLVLFGGTVTTMRAGMAESGWIHPDGHFLWFYPFAERVRNAGVFVEHHHRELGSLVGILAILAAIAAWRFETRPPARRLPAFALLAVCVQGLIGGLRVLRNSPDLAFLHGTLAQVVFAFLAATAIYLSPRWKAVAPVARPSAAGLQRTASLGVVIVLAQVTIGAWLRHSGSDLALALHVILALGVVGAIVVLGRQLRASASIEGTTAEGRAIFLGIKRRLHLLVGVQVLLGLLATFWIYEVSGGMQGPVSTGELVFATAHVAVGALLLAQMVAAAMWTRRVVCTPERSASLAVPQGAR